LAGLEKPCGLLLGESLLASAPLKRLTQSKLHFNVGAFVTGKIQKFLDRADFPALTFEALSFGCLHGYFSPSFLILADPALAGIDHGTRRRGSFLLKDIQNEDRIVIHPV
jgi:hypothetical protein